MSWTDLAEEDLQRIELRRIEMLRALRASASGSAPGAADRRGGGDAVRGFWSTLWAHAGGLLGGLRVAPALVFLLVGMLPGGASAEAPSDAWITAKVKIALLSADRVDGLDIDVDTVDGTVTLHGTVDSSVEKDRARELASEVEGVREVRDMLAVVPASEQEEVERADTELRQDVETVLGRDAALEGSDIEVASVNDGIVVLRGEAETLSAHRRALEDARAIEGVRRVTSEIRSPDRLGDEELWSEEGDEQAEGGAMSAASDTWITTKTKVRLIAEPGLSPFAINVDTRRGVVTLFGSVSSEDIKERAGAQAQKVAGVRAVENELQVVPDVAAERQERDDDAVRVLVNERLSGSPELEASSIDVAVENGVVRLTGRVESQEDRLRALTLSSGTEGVSSVIDDLEVRARS